VECGLRKPALSLPFLSLTGQQAIAEKPATVLDDAVLPQVCMIAKQNELDQVRTIDEVNVNPAGTIIENIAVFSCPSSDYREGITARKWHIADQKMWLWTGRALLHGFARCRLLLVYAAIY
jgi:hypothetical protein